MELPSAPPRLPVPLPPPRRSPTDDDPEQRLLREFVTLGMLIKILVALGSALVLIGGYEVLQLDKLRDETRQMTADIAVVKAQIARAEEVLQLDKVRDETRQMTANVAGLQAQIAHAEREVTTLTSNVRSASDSLSELRQSSGLGQASLSRSATRP